MFSQISLGSTRVSACFACQRGGAPAPRSQSACVLYVRSAYLRPMPNGTETMLDAECTFFVVAVCALTASVVVIAYWIGIPHWWARSPTATVVLMVVGHWLLVNICFHYYMGTVTPPGFPPEGSLIPEAASICKKCIAPKPPRTHHCSVCNRCILKMDHHCPWLNNCVGHSNHRYFFLYMVYVVAGVLFLMVFGVQLAYEEVWLAEEEEPPIEGHPVRVNDTMLIPVTEMNVNASLEAVPPPPARSLRRNCIIYMAFITSGVFVALGSLSLWHARLIGRGETSIEANINKAETKRLAARNKVQENHCFSLPLEL
ncbi:Palmitoyltransferase Hip14 [Gryllus bimaculatus]|nr:Palmitoyltransferase Hip14 [Gryllus bimaculatus]